MFQGAALLNLDQKARLAIPARHREALGGPEGRVVVTAHPQNCLYVFPIPDYEALRDQILAKSPFDPYFANLRRLIIGYAREEEFDAAGRLLIAPELRSWGALDKQVWLIGQGRYFELWSDVGWKAQQAKMVEQLQQAPAGGFPDFVL